MGKIEDDFEFSILSNKESDNFAVQIGNQRGEIYLEKYDAGLCMKPHFRCLQNLQMKTSLDVRSCVSEKVWR